MQIKEQIVNWLSDYLIQSNMYCFVVGVSGGIDSAVVSTLCAETGMSTLVVSLPIDQNADQLQLANNHIDWLTSKYSNVSPIKLNLGSVFEEFANQIADQIGHAYVSKLAFANSRSRLRMMSLYQIAQSQHGLVVGTGNKVEDFGVGFFTKYGDGGVDISPIGDLFKSQVYELARELGVLQAIQDAKPTDGLWEDNRTDQDQLGATYDELEYAMQNPDGPPASVREQEVLAIYHRFNQQNQHKMQPIPVCKIK